MKAYYTYYNTSMLVLHEYNLNQKSLYELFNLRNSLVSNKEYIVEKLNENAINTIDITILNKSNGSKMLEIIENNNILRELIRNNQSCNIEDNFDLLKLYKNINRLEKIFGFHKDSLLSNCQIKNRLYLNWKYFFDIVKEKLLLCKW